LRRDPHVPGWLEYLWKLRTPTGGRLTSSTRGQQVLRLRTRLDLLADLPQPPMPGLLCGQDVPPRQYRLPRPLTPADDARLQQHGAAATDVLRDALLLQRLTGMRIGECVDLAPDGLRHLGDNRWSLHVPHGKPRSARWVPVEDQVRVAIERLTLLRTLPPAADPQFLLARPKGRDVLPHDPSGHATLILHDGGLQRVRQLATRSAVRRNKASRPPDSTPYRQATGSGVPPRAGLDVPFR
jgi:integrase